MEGLAIREFTMADYADCAKLWGENRQMNGPMFTEEGVLSMFERSPELSFVASLNGKIVGCVLGTYDGRLVYLRGLSVTQPLQRKGIGRTLVERVEEEAHKIGAVGVALITERARPFYEKLGYEFVKVDYMVKKYRKLNSL